MSILLPQSSNSAPEKGLKQGKLYTLLQVYGVGTQVMSLLGVLVGGQILVMRTRGFHGNYSTTKRSVTKEEPLYPIVFNMVMYVLVIHWLTWVHERQNVQKVLGMDIGHRRV